MRRLATLLTVALMAPQCAFAGDALIKFADKVQEFTLANGLRVLVVERHNVPRVTAHVYYKVGSVNEPVGRTGMAHLLEHMMFKGTHTMGVSDLAANDRINTQIDAIWDSVYTIKWLDAKPDSARMKRLLVEVDTLLKQEQATIRNEELWSEYTKAGGTDLNAFTSEDFTAYVVTLPSNKLELQMLLESDRMSGTILRQFYSEREVVREERRLSENRPGFFFDEMVNATLYSSSGYHWEVLGWDIDLQKLKKTDLEDYYHSHYMPNNAVAVYVGDVTLPEVKRLAEKYFGAVPRGPEPARYRTPEVPQRSEKRLNGEADRAPYVEVLYHSVKGGDPDEPVFDVIGGLLSGATGRLNRDLVLDKQIATSAYAYNDSKFYAGSMTIHVEPNTAKNISLDSLEKLVMGHIEKLKTDPVPAHELEKVKNRRLADQVQLFSQPFGLAITLGASALRHDWRDIDAYMERLQQVTPADVQRVMQKYFVKDERVVAQLTRVANSTKSADELESGPMGGGPIR